VKIFLASFLEPHNFGPGKVIGIANGNKPSNIKCDTVFPPLIPYNHIMSNYNDMSIKDPKNASKVFVRDYSAQLNDFFKKVTNVAAESNKNPIDVLPFENGDTLASWEREVYTNYRPLVASYLKRLGFEVEQH